MSESLSATIWERYKLASIRAHEARKFHTEQIEAINRDAPDYGKSEVGPVVRLSHDGRFSVRFSDDAVAATADQLCVLRDWLCHVFGPAREWEGSDA